MADNIEYLAIVGLRESIDNPSGLVRWGGGVIERFNRSTLKWEHDGEVAEYFTGKNDDGEPITEESANRLIGLWMNYKG
tara:strand:- start:180 stop:416 length:237 start_codon:yes stop_codon:yes gene_type:complete